MSPLQIFISYRRDDTAGYARALCDRLSGRFGADSVFMDVDDIGAGQAFADVIHRAVGDAHVLLVLIGPRWRGERAGAPARLDDAGDFVRLEVAAGLARGMRVVPLLLDGAAMPAEAQLPADMRGLAGRNALVLDDTRFNEDVGRLVTTLSDALGEAAAPRRRRTLLWAAGAAVVLIAAAAVGYWQYSVRPAVNGAWVAEVVYDWPNARFTERFEFRGDGDELRGGASFLGLRRRIVEGGRVDRDGLRFVTRTSESGQSETGQREEVVHRYRGVLVGNEIRFTMQTEGASTPHAAVEFVARPSDRP